MKHVCKRLDKNNALYRGKLIELREHIPTGYHGRYRVGFRLYTTQKEAKDYIDSLCLNYGKESFMTNEETKQFIEEWI